MVPILRFFFTVRKNTDVKVKYYSKTCTNGICLQQNPAFKKFMVPVKRYFRWYYKNPVKTESVFNRIFCYTETPSDSVNKKKVLTI